MKILRKSQGICLGSKTRDRNEEQWSYGLTNKLDMAKKRISELCLGSKTRDRNEEQWSYGLTNKLDMAKKRISELEGTATETSKTDFFLLL
jgi:hypothetical protein